MSMNVRDIQYFSAIAEHRHLGKAAEALGLSQPALSMSLRRLEQSMGAKLVKRTPKGVDLTAVGTALFGRVRGLRLSLEDITREAADLSEGRAGHLRVLCSGTAALNLIPKACLMLRKEFPKVTMSIAVGGRNTATPENLRNGTTDLAITTIEGSRHGDLAEEFLYQEEFAVYAAARHRLAKRRLLTLADLIDEQWVLAAIHGLTEQRLTQAFVDKQLPPPRVAFEVQNLALRQELVSMTDLLGFSAREVATNAARRLAVVALRVKDLAYSRRASVIYRNDAYLSPAARRFIEILKIAARDLAPQRQ